MNVPKRRPQSVPLCEPNQVLKHVAELQLTTQDIIELLDDISKYALQMQQLVSAHRNNIITFRSPHP